MIEYEGCVTNTRQQNEEQRITDRIIVGVDPGQIRLNDLRQRQEAAKQVSRREEIGQEIYLGLVLVTFVR